MKVCTSCGTPACWQGVLMCEDARTAGVTEAHSRGACSCSGLPQPDIDRDCPQHGTYEPHVTCRRCRRRVPLIESMQVATVYDAVRQVLRLAEREDEADWRAEAPYCRECYGARLVEMLP